MTQETPTTAKERARKALVNFSNTDKFSELELIESVTQAITEAEDAAYFKGRGDEHEATKERAAKVARAEKNKHSSSSWNDACDTIDAAIRGMDE